MSEPNPETAGFDAALLQEAVDFHIAHETAWPRSMVLPNGQYIGTASIGDRPEHAAVLGPFRPRGGPNGLILRRGHLAAEWGDTRRPDMTFSIAKSYLALLAGVALGDGLIASLDDRVARTVAGPWFEGPQNAPITWRHLLQLSSEWSGTLWGKPDSADHNRIVGGADGPAVEKGEPRELKPPGCHFEYNDVRVNLLAACLTARFARPLPDVLRERIMDPIGASHDWEWLAYEGANVDCGGVLVPSVPGGGHWGGGLFIGSRDHALVGALVLQDGIWDGKQILPRGYIREMLTPSALNAGYGLFWWLNGGTPARYPSAPRDSAVALGAGASLIWIVPSLQLVSVLRWIDGASADAMLAKIMAAVR